MAVLIENDELVIRSWQLRAREAGVNLQVFRDGKSLLHALPHLPKDVPFYFDSHLSNEEKGEELAQKIYQMGYTSICLVTGYPPDRFSHCHWIQAVLSKDPPWKTK